MQPTKISIRNFKTIKELDLDLSNYKDSTVFIVGKNMDEEGADSNRAGKSNFIKALNWCLWGISQIDSGNDEITTYGEKDTVVSICFGDKEITRSLKNKAQSFSYKISGVEVAGSNAECEELFLSDFGIKSKNIIKNGIYLSSTTGTLVSTTPKERLNIFTEWFGLEKYDKAVEIGRGELRDLRTRLSILENTEAVEPSEIEAYNKDIKNLVLNLETKKFELKELQEKQKVWDSQSSLKSELSTLESFINDKKDSNKKSEDARKELHEKFLNNPLSNIENMEKEYYTHLEKLDKDVADARDKMLNDERCLNNLKGMIKTPFICPECKTELSLNDSGLGKYNDAQVKKSLEMQNEEYQKAKTAYDKIQVARSNVQAKIKKITDEKNEYKSIVSKITELFDFSEQLKRTIEIKKELGGAVDYSNELSKLSQDIEQIVGNISHKKALVLQLETKLLRFSEAKDEINKLKTQEHLLFRCVGERTKIGVLQKIKNVVLEKSTEELEIITNNNLTNLFKINTSIKLEINSKGIEIYQNNEHPVESMSAGEKARVNFSIALALSKIHSTCLQLLFIDEFFQNLDATGMEQTADILRSINGMTFVVTHMPIDVEHSIILKKKNGITTLEEAY